MTGSEPPFSPGLLLQDPGPKYNFLSPELRARRAPRSPGLGPTLEEHGLACTGWRAEGTLGFRIRRSEFGYLTEPFQALECQM